MTTIRQRVQGRIRPTDRLTKMEMGCVIAGLETLATRMRTMIRQEREATGSADASTIMSLMEYEMALHKIKGQSATFGKGREVFVEVPQ